jgi:1-deoxy-D-xylulose-5-phosphate synthase
MKYNLLKKINDPKDLRQLNQDQLPEVAQELREFIIDVVATKEGHLGASLGTVELTLALHYVFATPDDKLIWDVGHQAYGHKIITGRRVDFHTNRQWNGIAGFPKITESQYDTFGAGHSSTSLSAALGMALAAQQNKLFDRQHIAVIGDASIASGMAFEALNHAGVTDANLLIILNDNAIGIDPSVGALKQYLAKSKPTDDHSENTLFHALNIDYHGPIDGHNMRSLLNRLRSLKQQKGVQLLHIQTVKGKGLPAAEQDQVTYHAPGKFDKSTGKREAKPVSKFTKYQDVFGLTLLELAKKDKDIMAITPAMPSGSSLHYMMKEFPDRALDVGIAEQHAVTLSAGLALQGKKVFCVIYSTFLQRAYDQLIHDVALQNIPVIFCIDRAGLVGHDGPTHHGVFDIAYLKAIPNLIVAAASDEQNLQDLLFTAAQGLDQPIAIRYPRGKGAQENWQQAMKKIQIGKGKCLKKGKAIAVLSFGSVKANVDQAIQEIAHQVDPAHYDLQFAKPLDTALLNEIFANYEKLICVEDGSKIGGIGESVKAYAQEQGFLGKISLLAVPDRFIQQGNMEDVQQDAGISIDTIINELVQIIDGNAK